MVTRSVFRLAAAAVMLASLAACEFDRTTLAPPESRIVIHAVLDPSFQQQQIFLERTLTGRIFVNDTTGRDGNDPIVTTGGDPISNAVVILSRVGGDSARAVERSTVSSDGRGKGVYIINNNGSPTFPNSSLRILSGERYRIRVTTADGRVATAETQIPLVTGFTTSGARIFYRDTDTLKLTWTEASRRRIYTLRIDSPYGAFFLWSDSTKFNLNGNLRNFFADPLPNAFLAGYDQEVTVTAVDTNFYDYYRTRNDPFSGRGLVTHVIGGTGLFGSSVTIQRQVVRVSKAAQPDSVEGHYPRSVTSTYGDLDLFVDQKEGDFTALTGRLNGSGGVVGSMRSGVISFAVLRAGGLVRDTLDVFSGVVGGDSIAGRYKRTSTVNVVYRRSGRALP